MKIMKKKDRCKNQSRKSKFIRNFHMSKYPDKAIKSQVTTSCRTRNADAFLVGLLSLATSLSPLFLLPNVNSVS